MPYKAINELTNILKWAKENIIQAFVSLSALGGLASSLIYGYGMFNDIKRIPKLEKEFRESYENLYKNVSLNTKTIRITHSVLKEELETIPYNETEIYQSNSKDHWYFYIEDNRSYVFSANHKRKTNKFYYFDFENHYHEIGEKDNKQRTRR